jgi:hypothetical protein
MILVRIVSTLLLRGALLFVAFLLFIILYPRKPRGQRRRASTSSLQPDEYYSCLAPVARPHTAEVYNLATVETTSPGQKKEG